MRTWVRRHRAWCAVVVVLLVAGVGAAVVLGARDDPTATPDGVGVIHRSIPGDGGTPLDAYVIVPKSAGTHPFLVMPASYGATAQQYLYAGQKLAADGYAVISYAQRGFSTSKGQIDFAGTKTRADVSAVIDWAIRHAAADPNRIGAVGISYGGGMSLLAAEADKRIKAVVAMSAWTDLYASLFPGGVPAVTVLTSLFGPAAGTRLAPELQAFYRQYASGDVTASKATMRSLARSRSPVTNVASLNTNRTAVMLANGYEDSLFPSNQLTSFFSRLTGPKRLQLAVGDHSGPETSGIFAKPNQVWSDATGWLDLHLRNRNDPVGSQGQIQLQDGRTGRLHHYADLRALAATGRRYLSGATTSVLPTGVIQTAPAGAWSRRIAVGTDTVADSAVPQLDGTKTYQRSVIEMYAVARPSAAVWEAPAVTRPTLFAGLPALRFDALAGNGTTLFAYLYDTDATGTATLIATQPRELAGTTPGAAVAVAFSFGPIAYTLAANHHLSVVLDTVDPRFRTPAPDGSELDLRSSTSSPASFVFPAR